MSIRICGYCHQPLRGSASINGVWYCHPDAGQDCYQLAQWKSYAPHDCREA